MDAEKYNRQIQLLCPTCGSSTFEYDEADESKPVKCVGCGRELTREELNTANSENIAEHVKEIQEEFVKDAAKELRDRLKKAFSGSKNIKFK